MVRKIWQYDANVVPESTSAESPHPDAFANPPTEIPQANWARAKQAIAVALIPTTFFVNTVGGSSFPESPHVDGFNGYHPDYIYRPKEERYLFPSYFAIETTTFPESPHVDGFSGYHPDYIFRFKEQRYTYPSYFAIETTTFPETITIDKWIPQYPSYIFKAKDFRFTYPSYFAIETTTFPETIFIDKWVPSYPDYLFRFKEERYLFQSTFLDPNPIPNPVSVGGMTYENEITPISFYKTIIYPSTMETMLNFEVITPDKWIGSYPDKIFDIKRNQYLYPYIFPDQIQQTTAIIVPTLEVSLVNYYRNFMYQSYVTPVNFGITPSVKKTKGMRYIVYRAQRFMR